MQIKKREDIEKKYTWATEDLYKTEEDFLYDLENVCNTIDKISSYKGRLCISSTDLINYFKLKDEIKVKFNRINGYAGRKFDENTMCSAYQNLSEKVKDLSVKLNSSTSFEIPEIINMSDEKLNEFYNQDKELLIYKTYIENIRRQKPHTLSEVEEKLLASARIMADSPASIMTMFRNADIKFPETLDEDGSSQKLTFGTYMKYMSSENREVRKDAFYKMYGTLDKFKNTVSSAYFAHVKQQIFYARARNYNSTMEKFLSENNIPTEVYGNLIETVHNNLHHMHRYISLRKKILNIEDFHMYDLYAPLIRGSKREIDIEEAKKEVYDALYPLGTEYRNILKMGFENRWIDVYETEGKRVGAYSIGVYVHPFVLLNYANNLGSEFTLAHEMGHAVHSYLSNEAQPIVYTNYKTFVAEVASTFNESLLINYLLKKSKDKLERATLIIQYLEKFRGTLYRQTMFAEFEYITHKMAEDGKTLTADTLNKVYYELNKQYFGSDIIVDNEIAYEWMRIPHFFRDFYVYQYATGFSAAIALSNKILNSNDDKDVKNYLNFLRGGCSMTPIELLKGAGVDMSTPEPINEALGLFGRLVTELDELLK